MKMIETDSKNWRIKNVLQLMALPVSVYRNTHEDKGWGNWSNDCTNGGISAKENNLLVIHPEGFVPITEDNLHQVVIIQNRLCGKSLVPVVRNPIHTNGQRKSVGPCFGGNFAYSCDSRFHELSQYPLPIHDRWDTEADFESLSR